MVLLFTMRGNPRASGGAQAGRIKRSQWLIIHGRLLGKDLAPLAAVTVALRTPLLPLLEQHPHPDGWRRRP